MADEADNRDQHVVPRFYLNLFAATSEKKLHVRPKGQSTFEKLKSTKTQAVEKHAFTVVNNGERDMSGDAVNKLVETRTAPYLKSLSPAAAPTEEEWQAIWVLTANLLARSRRTRHLLTESIDWAEFVAAEIVPVMNVGNPLSEKVADLFGMTPEQLDEIGTALARANEVVFSLIAAEGTEPIANDLREIDCNLLIAPDGTNFITSDDPVVVYVDGEPVTCELRQGFLQPPNVEAYLALSPRIAVLWSAKQCKQLTVMLVTKEEVEKRNRDVWDSSYKCVFGCRRDELDALP